MSDCDCDPFVVTVHSSIGILRRSMHVRRARQQQRKRLRATVALSCHADISVSKCMPRGPTCSASDMTTLPPHSEQQQRAQASASASLSLSRTHTHSHTTHHRLELSSSVTVFIQLSLSLSSEVAIRHVLQQLSRHTHTCST